MITAPVMKELSYELSLVAAAKDPFNPFHFSPMFHFYIPLKFSYLTFSGAEKWNIELK